MLAPMGLPARRRASLEDLLRAEAEDRAMEIIGGELVEKSMSDQVHGAGSVAIAEAFGPTYGRRAGGGRPGGWRLRVDVDILFSSEDILRPDLSGWRRDRVPEMPDGWPVPVTPDWVCEILSPSTAHRDLGVKRDLFHRARVGHYWVVDRANHILLVYRWGELGYHLVQTGGETETIHAEPFEAVGLFVGRLFGIDPPDEEG
jgi:Uma2 family endonuclease